MTLVVFSAFVDSRLRLRACLPRFFCCPNRYLTYGSATAKAAALMAVPEVEDFFTRLIMRVAPKSYAQANGEVVVTRRFLENFSGESSEVIHDEITHARLIQTAMVGRDEALSRTSWLVSCRLQSSRGINYTKPDDCLRSPRHTIPPYLPPQPGRRCFPVSRR